MAAIAFQYLVSLFVALCVLMVRAMAVIEGTTGEVFSLGSAPGAGTNQIWTLTIDATGGTFRLSYGGVTTAAISWSATNSTLVAAIDAALEALSTIGTGGVVTAVGTMTAGVGTITITAGGNLAKRLLGAISVANNSLTGTATLTVTATTPGVDADFRGQPIGTLVVDNTTGILYANTGTALIPVWTKVGTQT